MSSSIGLRGENDNRDVDESSSIPFVAVSTSLRYYPGINIRCLDAKVRHLHQKLAMNYDHYHNNDQTQRDNRPRKRPNCTMVNPTPLYSPLLRHRHNHEGTIRGICSCDKSHKTTSTIYTIGSKSIANDTVLPSLDYNDGGNDIYRHRLIHRSESSDLSKLASLVDKDSDNKENISILRKTSSSSSLTSTITTATTEITIENNNDYPSGCCEWGYFCDTIEETTLKGRSTNRITTNNNAPHQTNYRDFLRKEIMATVSTNYVCGSNELDTYR